MAIAQTIIDSSKDIFTSLPLLLAGFSFLFGLLTSNTGLIWLFIGQILYVPAITMFVNQDLSSIFKNQLSGLLSLFIILLPILGNSVTYFTRVVEEEEVNISSFGSGLFNIILLGASQYITNKSPPPSSDTTCSLLPSTKGDISWTTPSAWTAQIVFFTSYVISNAMELFLQPSPSPIPVTGLSGLQATKSLEKQQETINQRVYNRKVHAGWIIFAASITALVLLIIQYKKTMCEAGFLRSLVPLLTLFSSGAIWFTFVSNTCGVAPVDILGIMTKLGNSNMSQNPIICTGQPGQR